MILKGGALKLGGSGAPRACGDDPTLERHEEMLRKCSPRMRG